MTYVTNFVKLLLGLAMIVAVIVVGLFIFRATNFNFNFGSGSSGSAPTGQQATEFTINPGDTVSTVADRLKAQGIIDSPFWFKLQLKLKGQESGLKAGTFEVKPGMDTDALIKTITTAPIEIGVRFTVIEGMRLEEIAAELSAQGIVDKAKFVELADTPEGAARYALDYPILRDSGRPADKGLEGYLFPDTYEIKKDAGDNSDKVIRAMLDNLEKKITPEMRQTMADRNLNLHQILTVSAIVQREGKVKDELPTIASVYWNRLEREMLFNADPTVQYAVGKEGQWWPELSLDDLKVDSPFNTYKVAGMPPAPICGSGIDAISASINPAQTEFLYFVAKGDGSHAFAKTLDEQERNRVIYGNR